MTGLSRFELENLQEAISEYHRKMAVLAGLPWRWGRHEPVHLYAQLGAEPSDDDPVLGTLFTPELAEAACAAHNSQLSGRPALEAVRAQAQRYMRAVHGEQYAYRAPEAFPNVLERWIWAVASGAEGTLGEDCIRAIEERMEGDRD
jgi:hypothetical protein